jgi:hypothetical protein
MKITLLFVTMSCTNLLLFLVLSYNFKVQIPSLIVQFIWKLLTPCFETYVLTNFSFIRPLL